MVKVETYHTGSKRKPIAQLRRTINNRVSEGDTDPCVFAAVDMHDVWIQNIYDS
ncbi:unnamed protein product [Brassica rapa]|uniref:Uncharacterized protein n=2 Tax=Brassica TaxID=3705 RepID=A0A8D9GIK0_BRACM|nr:unnamed protein product [Brassica napus]CAG7881214.1 unnamed protein product [Brassica rapa]